MVPYFCATWAMASDTPELTPPIRKLHSYREIIFSATRDAVSGLVSVSWWIHWIFRPSKPPRSLNSEMAMRIPRDSLAPLLPYWPVASVVSPIVMGLFRAEA